MKPWFMKKEKIDENGAVIVEATIALPVFIFAILMLLSLVDICYVQSKMSVALNSAAKEMSQYGYLYTTLHMNEHMSGKGGKSSEIMASFSEVLNTISEKTGVVSDELSSMFSTAGGVAAGDSAAEYIKDGVGMELAKQLVKKNLVSYKNDTAENFLLRNQVVDGIDGLNFMYTSFLTNAEQDEVDIIVSYKIRVIKLLNIDYKFSFVQRATSKVWGSGVSLRNSEDQSSTSTNETSIWDTTNDLSRGDTIIKEEKKKYEYISDDNGFHAYDKEKNEFIRILSMDLTEDTYSDPITGQKAIKNKLESSFNTLYNGVGWTGENVTLQDPSGNDVVVQTPKDGRSYKIVLVVPENVDMEKVKAAVEQFEKEKAELGIPVTVEIETGYGTPSSSMPQTEA